MFPPWKRRLAALAVIMPAMMHHAFAIDAATALGQRNPYLAALARSDPATFAEATALIAEVQRERGLSPERAAPPPTAPSARGMAEPFFNQKTFPENPDILWLYNASPEGMHDLIALLKSAGSKPKK